MARRRPAAARASPRGSPRGVATPGGQADGEEEAGVGVGAARRGGRRAEHLPGRRAGAVAGVGPVAAVREALVEEDDVAERRREHDAAAAAALRRQPRGAVRARQDVEPARPRGARRRAVLQVDEALVDAVGLGRRVGPRVARLVGAAEGAQHGVSLSRSLCQRVQWSTVTSLWKNHSYSEALKSVASHGASPRSTRACVRHMPEVAAYHARGVPTRSAVTMPVGLTSRCASRRSQCAST